jgi:hypothetical protein
MPETRLQDQIQTAVAGQSGALLPVQPAGWMRAQTVMGEHIRDALMNKDEWEAEDIDGFFRVSAAALGLKVETVPNLEDGEPLVFEEEKEEALAEEGETAS